MYIYICVCVSMYVCMHACIVYVNMQRHINMYMLVNVIYMYIVYVCVHACLHAQIHICNAYMLSVWEYMGTTLYTIIIWIIIYIYIICVCIPCTPQIPRTSQIHPNPSGCVWTGYTRRLAMLICNMKYVRMTMNWRSFLDFPQKKSAKLIADVFGAMLNPLWRVSCTWWGPCTFGFMGGSGKWTS